MSVYITHFIINMIAGMFFTSKHSRGNRLGDRIYLFVTFLQFGLLCGMRSTSVGYDTLNYSSIFNLSPDSFATIFENNRYIEIGFSVFCSIIKILGGNYQTMFIISSLFVMGSACVFIYRHSKNPVLSVFILISFPFYYSSFDIIRHFIATAFFLLGYKYVVEKNFVKYVLCLFIGSLFHAIAWLFLPFYFIRKLKWNSITIFGATIITILSFEFLDQIAIWLSMLINKSIPEGWVNSYGGGMKTAIMYFAILLIAIASFYNQKNRDPDKSCALNHVMILFIFSLIFINARIMTRLIMTSVPLLAIAIPELLCDKNNIKNHKNNVVFMLAFILIGFVYHAFMLMTGWQKIIPYVAYWQ